MESTVTNYEDDSQAGKQMLWQPWLEQPPGWLGSSREPRGVEYTHHHGLLAGYVYVYVCVPVWCVVGSLAGWHIYMVICMHEPSSLEKEIFLVFSFSSHFHLLFNSSTSILFIYYLHSLPFSFIHPLFPYHIDIHTPKILEFYMHRDFFFLPR